MKKRPQELLFYILELHLAALHLLWLIKALEESVSSWLVQALIYVVLYLLRNLLRNCCRRGVPWRAEHGGMVWPAVRCPLVPGACGS